MIHLTIKCLKLLEYVEHLLVMEYDKCVSDKNGGRGKGQHSSGQDGVLISGDLVAVHPAIEYGGARRDEEHAAGHREEYIDALVQLGAQQVACNCNGICSQAGGQLPRINVGRYYLCSMHCI